MTESSEYLWVEQGDSGKGAVVDVAPLTLAMRTMSYAVPAELEDQVLTGQIVQVPVGRSNRATEAIVVAVDRRKWDRTLRPIQSIVDHEVFLTPDLMALGREISDHYATPLGRSLKAMMPSSVRRRSGLRSVRYVRLARADNEAEPRGLKRRAIVAKLREQGDAIRVSTLLEETGASSATLRALVRDGRIEQFVEKEARSKLPEESTLVEPKFELHDQQMRAIDQADVALSAKAFSVLLLHGVSGSGKTEVYIRAMSRVVREGGQAILLVPEIVLTTQMVQRLSSRFTRVAVVHSGLTDAQRAGVWRGIQSGEFPVVLGTRSAVFAPCPKLGLICVDEEQEGSFKNLQAPRFHVRDVGIMRAKLLGIPIVLGSATPAVETWYNSEHRPEYTRACLGRRVNERPLPKVHVVDMRDEIEEQKREVLLSRAMISLLGEALDRNEQAILLMNRRGFAERIYCPNCKMRLTCPNCQVGLVVHRAAGQSRCHYCRTRVSTPTHCSNVSCRSKLVHLGAGTQRVEEVLGTCFPKARVCRVDSDTMRHRDHYLKVIDGFRAREIDVLVGTQMIAKGLDFPHVSFVGVVHADIAGFSSDFRSQERLFQLVTQVAGRAGRADTRGEVVVQTTSPESPAIRHALSHDYESFVGEELAARRRAGWPPFRRLVRMVLSDPREDKARQAAVELVKRLRSFIAERDEPRAQVLGPSPCVLARLRGQYRYDLLLRCLDAGVMRRLLAELQSAGVLRAKVSSLVVDVDPVSLT